MLGIGTTTRKWSHSIGQQRPFLELYTARFLNIWSSQNHIDIKKMQTLRQSKRHRPKIIWSIHTRGFRGVAALAGSWKLDPAWKILRLLGDLLVKVYWNLFSHKMKTNYTFADQFLRLHNFVFSKVKNTKNRKDHAWKAFTTGAAGRLTRRKYPTSILQSEYNTDFLFPWPVLYLKSRKELA